MAMKMKKLKGKKVKIRGSCLRGEEMKEGGERRQGGPPSSSCVTCMSIRCAARVLPCLISLHVCIVPFSISYSRSWPFFSPTLRCDCGCRCEYSTENKRIQISTALWPIIQAHGGEGMCMRFLIVYFFSFFLHRQFHSPRLA